MKYIIRSAAEPILHKYQKNSWRHRYITARLQKHTEGLLHQYERPFPPRKLPKYYCFPKVESELSDRKPCTTRGGNQYLSSRLEVKALAEERGRADLSGWERFFHQPFIAYSNNCKGVEIEKSQKMAFELVELKTDGSHYEFLIRESMMDDIVTWECLPDEDTVRQYLKEHPLPKDSLYPEKAFLEDVGKASGYIHLVVEKRVTAESICDLCCALICDTIIKGVNVEAIK